MPSNKKPSKPAKIKNALLAAVIVMALYTLALFLPNLASIIALFLGVLVFLATLYFDRDYRFFRIGTLALLMFGLQKFIPQLNFEINPSSVLFQLSSAENTTGAYDYFLPIIAIIGFVLDFLMEKEKSALKSIFSYHKAVNKNGNQVIIEGDIKAESGATVNISAGDSLDKKILEEIKQLAIEINQRLQDTDNPSERKLLEIEINALNEKLANTEKTLKEEKQLREETLQTIKQLKTEIPSKQLEKVQKTLQEKGDIKLAEQAFDYIVKQGSGPVAQAAFQSGKIAESRVDYAKAMAQYTIAVTLDKNNPDYLLKAGTMARTIGNYNSAQKWLEQLLSIREKGGEKKGGEEKEKNINLAMAQNEMAFLYDEQGKYEVAESLYQRSLAITEKVLGKGHPSVAATLNNLAGLYKAQGKYKTAEPLYQRDLKITEKAMGKDHLSVATTLNNLAELYQAQGKYEVAEPLYQRSLAITEKVLGKDHPMVAMTLNNLAELYQAQGKYEVAEPLYQQSLAITEKVLGKDHPMVATTLNNLAGLYKAQGKYEEAEPMYQRDIKITEKALGKDHPSVATTLNNLAALYYAQGNYKATEPLFQRAIQILEKTFPKGHPNIEITKDNYNVLKQKMAEKK